MPHSDLLLIIQISWTEFHLPSLSFSAALPLASAWICRRGLHISSASCWVSSQQEGSQEGLLKSLCLLHWSSVCSSWSLAACQPTITSSHLPQLVSAQVQACWSSFWHGLALLSVKTLKGIGKLLFCCKQPSSPTGSSYSRSIEKDYNTDTGFEESLKALGSVWLCINSRY